MESFREKAQTLTLSFRLIRLISQETQMFEAKTKNFLALALLTVAFAYRFMLMTINIYPPGADIGLHESVINTITSQKTNFFVNYYHMGGGLSATNPGYHIFTAYVITLTGLPDYLAQALVASVFSALLVACAFLLVRQVWGEAAAYVTSILLTFSASDINILSFGGYPNVVALALIPTIFYLFMQTSKISSKSYAIAASILISAIFLTHVFSAFIFVAITLVALLASGVLWKKTGLKKKQAISWVIPIIFGMLLVSPYLVTAVPIYFGSQSSIIGAVSGVSQAVVETRLIPLEIPILALAAAAMFFIFSRYLKGKFLTVPSVLFVSWIVVLVLGTQSYLAGVFLDYQRFIYFLSVPIFVCLALIVVYSPKAALRAARIASGKLKVQTQLRPRSKHLKTIITTLLIIVLLLVCVSSPLFAKLQDGLKGENFFKAMDSPHYQAIQWIKQNTPQGSVCVANDSFGWWLSGFAQRPTLSASNPEFLILQHELEPAKVASNFLAADYTVDNGLLEVQQTGIYANDNKHQILAILQGSTVRPLVFNLNDTGISLMYRENGSPLQLAMPSFTDSQTSVTNSSDKASFTITRENKYLTVTEQITVYRGVDFAQVSFAVKSKANGLYFDWLHMPFQSRGFPVQTSNAIAIVDNTLHMVNQFVFPNMQLGTDAFMQENPDSYELVYNLGGNSTADINFFVGLRQFNPDLELTQLNYLNSFIKNNTQNYFNKTVDLPLSCFDYRAAIKQWNISYIAISDATQISRFTNDPTFSLVFKNDGVAIFKTHEG
jgi:hypothetical protein